MLLQTTSFTVLHTLIVDDGGFPGLQILFNTTGTVRVFLKNPEKNSLFSETYYRGERQIIIHLANYRETPSAGKYLLQVRNEGGSVIFENELTFHGPKLTISEVTPYVWLDGNTKILTGMQLLLKNQGDLPTYPDKIIIEQNNDESISSDIFPESILPFHSQQLATLLDLQEIHADIIAVDIHLFDKADELIGNSSETLLLTTNTPTLEYRWRYKKINTLALPDISFLYQYYKSKERIFVEDYAVYIFDPYDDKYLDFVIEQLRALSDLSLDVNTVNFVASFVQNLQYAEDDPQDETCEYPRYPIELIKDKQGDCEDKAILTGALLNNLGFNVSLLRFPNHMAVGVNLPEDATAFDYYVAQYFFLETTKSLWTLGQVPEEYEGITNITVYSLSDRPVVIHSWKNATRYSVTDGSDYVLIQAEIENIGSASIYLCNFSGGFYDSTGTVHNLVKTELENIEPNEKLIATLQIDVPSYGPMTLKTQILFNNKLLHEKESSSTFP